MREECALMEVTKIDVFQSIKILNSSLFIHTDKTIEIYNLTVCKSIDFFLFHNRLTIYLAYHSPSFSIKVNTSVMDSVHVGT